MSSIRTTTGLISGIDIGGLVTAIVNAERGPARRLEVRLENTRTRMSGIGQLQGQLLLLGSSLNALKNRRTFTNLSIESSAPEQLTVNSKLTSIAGNYQFQTLQTASAQRSLSRGFANPDTQQLGGSGEIVISREGLLAQSTKLDLLNQAQGVQRGVIRITDRSGAVADVDLRNAVTWDDVVRSIEQSGLGIQASTSGGRLVLQDTTGQSAANLTVSDLAGGKTAADLGIRQSVASSILTGNEVFQVTADFPFSLLNDGNSLRNVAGAPELLITLSDGTGLDLDLDGTATVGDVLGRIQAHENNGGKLTAELQNGRIVLTDNSGGAGTLTVANLNQSNAREVLGLAPSAVDDVLTGQLLSAGNSVLLRNLRGGRGIDQAGEISLTDRTGATATIDLSHAETLDDVLTAINTATTDTLDPLQLRARLNAAGTGIEVFDTSGSTAGPLTIADVGGSTLAADLGIAVDGMVSQVDSGPLRLRTVNEATSLSDYSPRGTAASVGTFRITDSLGNIKVVNVTSDHKTVGDVIGSINAATGAQVSARLNDTGDGIVLVDNANGPGTLAVTEAGGRTAADLRLLGEGVVGESGKQEISGRRVQIVKIEPTNTLNDIMAKINAIGGTIRASIVNTGASVNGYRLSLTSTISGEAGAFVVEDGGMGLQFATQDAARDAVLRVGGDPATGFLLTSSSNNFTNVLGNFDVTVNQPGTVTANVTAKLNQDSMVEVLKEFVEKYNEYIKLSNELTKFDTATQSRSPLQGLAAPLTIQSRFGTLVSAITGDQSRAVRSLADMGVRVTTGGKLTFDESRFKQVVSEHPTQVQEFFTDPVSGFAFRFEEALNYFNDTFQGTLTRQYQSLERTADGLTSRIETIDTRLELRRRILETQFANMEASLSGLQSQQQALTGLSNMLEAMKSSR